MLSKSERLIEMKRTCKRKYNKRTSIMRYANPFDNLLYNVLLQALRDNDIDFIKSETGVKIWEYLER